MKRMIAGAICMLMLLVGCTGALCTDMDEQELAQMAEATDAPMEAPESQDYVYAQSDAEASSDEVVIDQGEPPVFVRLLLDIAIGEIGYEEGAHSYTKYGEWAGDPNAEWCAEFVCWCVNAVDEQYGMSILNNIYPNWGGQNQGKNWFIKRGRFVFRKGNCPDWGYQWLRGSDRLMKKNDYIPNPGDLVFFSYNEAGDTEHVAIVEYCTRDADDRVVIHVIEGNNPSAVARNTYQLNNSQVLGFGTCQDVADTTMRSGNIGDKVLELQQWLNELGLLDDIHLTGAFGGNTKAAVARFQEELMEDKTATGIADRQTQQAMEMMLADIINNSPDSWEVVD